MKFDNMISYYEEKTVEDKDNSRLENICKELRNNNWKEKHHKNKIIFMKGRKLQLTFNYTKAKLEVKIILEKLSSNKLSIKVGNSGFPFESYWSRKRYQKILHELIKNSNSKN